MLKFLRKYNKVILVVFGGFLMIAFLVPQALQQMGSRAGRQVVATLDGQPVRAQDVQLAAQEIQALEAFTPIITQQLLALDRQGPEHWMLLVKEAQSAGYVGDQADGLGWIPAIADLLMRLQLQQQYGDAAAFVMQTAETQQQVRELAARMEQQRLNAAGAARLTQEEFDRALAKARGVQRMMYAFERAARVSDRAVARAAKQALDSTFVDYAFIPAARFIHTEPQPTEEQIAAHFEKYRDVRVNSGPEGIGYRFPDRLKLEYMEFSAPAILEAVTPDPVEVRKRWQQNRDRFTGEFAAERANIEQLLRQELTQKALGEATKFLRAETVRATRNLPTQGAFRVLPADWDTSRPRLDALAPRLVDHVKAETGLTIPLPRVVSVESDFLTKELLGRVERLGISKVRVGRAEFNFVDVAFAVRELLPTTNLALQVGIPAVDLPAGDAQSGSIFFFTITAVRKEAAAESLDEVRDLVIRDIQRLAAFEKLKAEADQYRAAVADAGVQAVTDQLNAQADADNAARAEDAPKIPRVSKFGGRVRREGLAVGNPDLANPVFASTILDTAAAKLDPLKPATEQPAADRSLAIPIPDRLGLAIAQILSYTPVSEDTYRQQAEQQAISTQVTEIRRALAATGDGPFSLPRLTERHRLEWRARRDEAPAEAAPAAQPTPPAPADAATPPAAAN